MTFDSSAPRASRGPSGPSLAAPRASIVVPTKARPDYLRVTLASIAAQSVRAEAELIVVDDAGPSAQGRLIAERFGARYEPHSRPLGLNVARNTGVERSRGELVVFVDDDVEVCEGWLEALLTAAREHHSIEVFTGPILPRLEGSPPRSCGREGAPITALELGVEDVRTRFAWGANMAIRRSALERIGPFDVSLEHGGDEQEWQERLRAESSGTGHDRNGSGGGEAYNGDALYVGGAALHHRRSAADARLLALCRAAFARGKAARRFDAWRHAQPSLKRELVTLVGCLGHVVRRRCPAGLTMVAHSCGRVLETLRAELPGRPLTSSHHDVGRDSARGGDAIAAGTSGSGEAHQSDDFLSGESGTVGGLDDVCRTALDFGLDAIDVLSTRRLRLKLAARDAPARRRVLVIGVARPEHRVLVDDMRAELARSRHDVEVCLLAPGGGGKFENLNLLLDSHPPGGHDWLLVVDDDIVLPEGFLDRLIFLAEHFQLDLAQPAHRLSSHAAWRVTRRRGWSAVRETSFVEIGPVTAFARSTFSTLLPFPDLRMGWGLDLHWAALARERHWRCGVLDAIPIGHRVAAAASSYSREQALSEARAFLETRAYLSASEAQQTLVTHRRW
jgi:hypothetical protein